MPSNKLIFQNRHGDRIAARLDLPANCEPSAFALFAHCFTPSKDSKAAHTISHALTQEGIAVLRFDFTGLGEERGRLCRHQLLLERRGLARRCGLFRRNARAAANPGWALPRRGGGVDGGA